MPRSITSSCGASIPIPIGGPPRRSPLRLRCQVVIRSPRCWRPARRRHLNWWPRRAKGQGSAVSPRGRCSGPSLPGLIAVLGLALRDSPFDRIRPEYSRDVLTQKARDAIAGLGYDVAPARCRGRLRMERSAAPVCRQDGGAIAAVGPDPEAASLAAGILVSAEHRAARGDDVPYRLAHAGHRRPSRSAADLVGHDSGQRRSSGSVDVLRSDSAAAAVVTGARGRGGLDAALSNWPASISRRCSLPNRCGHGWPHPIRAPRGRAHGPKAAGRFASRRRRSAAVRWRSC